MIEYRIGDILHEDAEALVNTVNCVGIMGRGIALQFKNAFPDNFKAYIAACKRKNVQPGRMFVYETLKLTNPRYIINFPTKRHWRGKSRIEDIEAGLKALGKEIRNRNVKSIAIPPLGSGLGGLDWRQIRSLIEKYLRDLDDVEIRVYEPRGAPDAREMSSSSEVPKMTPGRAALVGLIRRYLDGLIDPFVTLLEVHKLMYFMQEAGEPLRLKFKPAYYGPYAENLRHVLSSIEGHLITGFADGGENPDKAIELLPGAIEDSDAFLTSCSKTRVRFDKVADLVDGFETPYGLELLSTVHWIIKNEQVYSLDEIINITYQWGNRKKIFTPSRINLAREVLAKKGWLPDMNSEFWGHNA